VAAHSQTECLPCDTGEYAFGTGNTGCDCCGVGKFVNPAQHACHDCDDIYDPVTVSMGYGPAFYQPNTCSETCVLIPTPTPTKAPTSTPTKAPTSTPTKAPTSTPTKAPTSTPTKAPTTAPSQACKPGQSRNYFLHHDDATELYCHHATSGQGAYLEALTASECPGLSVNFNYAGLGACNNVECGELCEGNGECGTDQSLNNCMTGNGDFDVYRRHCPDTHRRLSTFTDGYPDGEEQCVSCLPGFFSEDYNAPSCLRCPNGRYSAAESSDPNCQECPTGKYHPSSGSTCHLCAEGKYGDSWSNEVSCEHCPEGRYQSTEGYDDCIDCPVGKSNSGTGAILVGECTDSPTKAPTSSPTKAPTDSPTKAPTKAPSPDPFPFCAAGKFRDGYACFNCPDGKYQPYDIAAITGHHTDTSASASAISQCITCGSCPSGAYRVGCAEGPPSEWRPGFQHTHESRVSSTDTTGHAHTDWDGSVLAPLARPWILAGDCIGCPIGHYKESDGDYLTMCLDCPNGKFQGSTNGATCGTCPTGKYARLAHQLCWECEMGRYQNSDESHSCIACGGTVGVGDHQDTTGGITCKGCPMGRYGDALELHVCKECPKGKFQGDTSRTTCTKCDEGSYQDEVEKVACKDCLTGQYTDVKGKELCDNCLRCPSGNYRSGCGVATLKNDAGACLECDFGEWKVEGMNSGTYATTCKECPTGKYQDLKAEDECHKCVEGRYAVGPKAVTCDHCPKGKYQDTQEQADCDLCEEGKYNNVDLATESGKDACDLCEKGDYAETKGHHVCKECPKGKWNNALEQQTCTECVEGKYAAGLGNTVCAICDNGQYQDTKAQDSCINCDPCAAGSYRVGCGVAAPNNVVPGTCSACVEGTYKDQIYSWSTMCVDCELGHYDDDNIGTVTCKECQAGKYARRAHTICWICPRGKFATGPTNSVCTDCIQGEYATDKETAICERCPVGRYQHLVGKYFCYGCPEGKYQNEQAKFSCKSCLNCEYSTPHATSCTSLERDCTVSQWSAWSSCDQTCGEGLASRTRSVTIPNVCGGTCPEDLTRNANCMERPCDCDRVTCQKEAHSCTDYTHAGAPSGWEGIVSSNKGNCHNDGFHNQICGHKTNAGACAALTDDTNNACHDLDRMHLDNGRWVADPDTTLLGAGLDEYNQRQTAHFATCTGTHETIRVSHHRDERKFLTSDGAQHIEGHHCKMIGAACTCRCHRMFRHNYFPTAMLDYSCPLGKHTYSHNGVMEQLCIDDATVAQPLHVTTAHYNPLSCDNTFDTAVTQPTGLTGRTKFGARDAHINVHSDWTCKEDNSKFNFNYHPIDDDGTLNQPIASPTAAPTPNTCDDGTHLCDTTQISTTAHPTVNDYNGDAYAADTKLGFCLRTSHTGHVCGCIRDHKLASDGISCVYDESDTAGNGNRL
jgi:hypothetical protein